jgi:hypothetical protein
MSYQLTAFAKTREPLNRVPWRDLSDEEFAVANALYDGLLEERGYFEPEAPTSEDSSQVATEPTRIRGRRHVTEDAAAPAEED